jgi:hypothetical protein
MNFVQINKKKHTCCELMVAFVLFLLAGCVSFPSGGRSFRNSYSSHVGKFYTTLRVLEVEQDEECARQRVDAVYACDARWNDFAPLEYPKALNTGTKIIVDDVWEQCDYIQILPFPILPILYRRYYAITFYVEGEKRIRYHYYQQLPFDFYFHWPLDFSRLPFRLIEVKR